MQNRLTYPSDLTAISAFTGVGGFDIACEDNGIKVVAQIEKDKDCLAVLERHYPDVLRINDVKDANQENLPHEPFLFVGGSPCFAAGTLILTRCGYKPIEAIVVGDDVLTHTGQWQPVTSVMARNTTETVTLKIQGALTTVTTAEHPYYARRQDRLWNNERRSYDRTFSEPEWVAAGQLDFSQMVGQVLPLEESPDDHLPAFWWVVGRYLADGWRARRGNRPTGNIKIAVGKGKEEAFEQHLCAADFHVCGWHERTAKRYVINNKSLYHFLDQFGTGAENKHVPGWVLGIEKEKLRALIEGYLSGDGSRYTTKGGHSGGWSATTVSRKLALSMALVAQKALEVVANISEVKVKSTTVIEGRIVNQRTTRYSLDVPDLNRSAFIEGNYGWKKIRKVEKQRHETAVRVFNLSVRGNESYIANGCIVHNCQDLSTAGKRAGLGGDQSGLWYEYQRLLRELKPQWFVWENVPGVLSSGSADPFTGKPRPGLDFAIVLAGFTGVVPAVPAKGWRNAGVANGWFYNVAWRVLDAQFFGVAQRRRRLFVVGCTHGCGFSPAEILFEREGMSWNPPPRRKKGARPAGQAGAGALERDPHRPAQSDGDFAASLDARGAERLGQAGQGESGAGQNEAGRPDRALLGNAGQEDLPGQNAANPDGNAAAPADALSQAPAAVHGEALAFGSTGQGWYSEGIQTLRERDYKGDSNLVAHLHGGSHELADTEGMEQIPYNVLGMSGNAKQRHAYPTETANTLDTWAGAENKNAGGTFIVTDPQENERKDVAPTLSSSASGVARTGNERTEADFLIPVDHQQESFRLRAFGDYVEDDIASTTLERDHKYITDIISVEALDARNLNSEGDLSGTIQSKPNGGHSLNYINPVIIEQEAAEADVIAFMAGQGAKARSLDAHDDLSPTLHSAASGTNQTPTIAYETPEQDVTAFDWQAGDGGDDKSFRGKSRSYIVRKGEYAQLRANARDAIHGRFGVRRLLPIETERLQGFPDNWTKWRADGTEQSDTARYKQNGNALAVPVARWIIGRIVMLVRGKSHAEA